MLYDVTSSYYTGRTCPLAAFGHNRDKKKGLPIIACGLLTDSDGRPVAVDVYPGNTADPTTVPDQVEKLRQRFGLSRVVLVGDRGMLTQTQIDKLKEHPELGWISALRSTSIRKLIEKGELLRSLFDEEHRLDGIYVIRTSESEPRLSPADAVRSYKNLSRVEQAFRSMKGLELLVRPIHHRTAERVRAHILVCLLAYYVEWHLKQAWAPLVFMDEEVAVNRRVRDAVAPAQPSALVTAKKGTHQTADGLPVHSFRTLLSELATRCRNVCRLQSDPSGNTFSLLTEMSPVQAKALELLGLHV